MSAKPKRPPNERDAAAYIEDMSSAMAELARQHRLATLSYLFELAQMEAGQGRAGRGAGNASLAGARRRAAAQRSLPSGDQGKDQSADGGE